MYHCSISFPTQLPSSARESLCAPGGSGCRVAASGGVELAALALGNGRFSLRHVAPCSQCKSGPRPLLLRYPSSTLALCAVVAIALARLSLLALHACANPTSRPPSRHILPSALPSLAPLRLPPAEADSDGRCQEVRQVYNVRQIG